MIEMTVTIFEQDGELYGIGEKSRPSDKQVKHCCNRWAFVRGDVRIHVMAVTTAVTEIEARIFAIFMYEGKATKVEITHDYITGTGAIPERGGCSS